MGIFSKKAFNPGHCNFEAYRLIFSQEAVKVRYTFKSIIFYGIFAAMGSGFSLVFLLTAEKAGNESPLVGVIFGSIFFLIGALGIYFSINRRYPMIDLRQRIFYPFGKAEGVLPDSASALPISDIREIDIDSHFVSGNKSSYNCYELRLIFKDGKYFPFLHHGNYDALMRDAKQLSEVLHIPIAEDGDRDDGETHPAVRVMGGVSLLVFSLIWTGIVMPVHVASWRQMEWIGIAFSGVFVIVGVCIFIQALKMLFSKKM